MREFFLGHSLTDSETRLYFPSRGAQLSHDDIWRWFGNIPIELSQLDLTHAERSSFVAYYRDAGLLRAWRRPFFRRHYAVPLSAAANALFEGIESPRILDLGAGSGTQSLLFAMLGADVTAVDRDSVALGLLEKRKKYYEERTGRSLRVTIHESDVLKTDWASLGPFTGLYSLFAFNMMQPSRTLLAQLAPHFSSTAIVAIQDGNRAHFYKRVFHKRVVLGKAELAEILRGFGFADVRHLGGYAIPPPVWCLAPYSMLAPIDSALAKFDPLAVSFLHLARRRG